jgi:A/G-specific adenine glycosylase
MSGFSQQLLVWFDKHGRKDLPWQQNPTPYRVWISEIMLQQTQVATVIPYYHRFMVQFPDLDQLAEAQLDNVLSHWSGLGYYTRARNLHKAAQQIVKQHSGELPCSQEALESLPGIGRSTAGAIVAIACGKVATILDGNVKRVLTRYHAIPGWPGQSAVAKKLWQVAEQSTPSKRVADYTQAIMDLGATLCTRASPACMQCPLMLDCKAFKQGQPKAFPTPKPRKQRPIKACHFLIIENPQKQILLTRRPPTGIWGGLWSLPELEDGSQLDSYLQTNHQLNVQHKEIWPMLKHQFSHFELKITPVYVQVEYAPAMIKEMASEAMVWYNTRQSPPGGLPAPVAKLLQSYTRLQQTPEQEELR